MDFIGRPPRAKSQARSAISRRRQPAEGYKAGGKPKPYHGYYYRILKRQGAGAAGGAYDYVVNGKMIGGFALIAYPAQYGNSGIMTFIVNQDGTVFQKDLGERTEEDRAQDRDLRSGLQSGRRSTPSLEAGARGHDYHRLSPSQERRKAASFKR